MKYLVMTEGTCEKALLDLLLERNLLTFCRSELLYNEIYHLRQFSMSIYEKISQLNEDEKITIIRIGDKLDDELEIDDDYKPRIIACEKVCTKPEFEMLHIIYEGKFNDYKKVKSKIKPCEYLKTIVKDYEKTYMFNYNYFNKMNNCEITFLLKQYSKLRGKVHIRKTKNLSNILKATP